MIMKLTKIIAIALVIVMLLSMSVVAAEKQGLEFTVDMKYTASKTFEEAPVTFEAWINIPANVTGRGGIILGSWGTNEKNVNFEISDNGVPRFYADNGAIDAKFSETKVNTGEWVHLAIVYRASKSAVLCYVNGELVGTKTVSMTAPLDTSHKMCLGGDHRTNNEQYFKGKIASVAVYSDERNSDEIKSDMTSYGTDALIAHYELPATAVIKINDLSGNGYDQTRPVVWMSESEIEPLDDFAYSFAVIGDTQRIAYNYKDRFGEIYQWILDNAEDNNTQFVMGLGDITETSSDAEWTAAMNAITKLDGKISYSLVRGNHDSVDTFNRYVSMEKYGSVIDGSYEGDMRNTYQKFSVGDVKYMVFTLDYGASNKVLAWAKEIIDANLDYNVILTTHAYLYRDGTTLDADDVCPPATTGGKNNGDHIWDKLASQCENIVLVLSGHDPCDNIIVRQEKGVKGNTVTQMLIDPQGADNVYGGLGAVAMFYFSEDGKDVTVRYYATLQDKYFMSDSQFTMKLDVVGDDESVDVGGNENGNVNDNNNGGNIENNDNNNNNNNNNNDAPLTPDNTEGTEAPTDAPEASESEDEGGCGSVVSIGAVGIVALTALGVSFAPRKKRR